MNVTINKTPVGVPIADGVVTRVLLLISSHIETHFLAIAFAFLALAFSWDVALGGLPFRASGMCDGRE